MRASLRERTGRDYSHISDAEALDGIEAGAFGFKPAELFEITDVADRNVPTVDLSRH